MNPIRRGAAKLALLLLGGVGGTVLALTAATAAGAAEADAETTAPITVCGVNEKTVPAVR